MHMLKPWSEAQGGLRCLNVDASAAKAPDGSLVATFTADLPKKPEEILGSPFNIIYAIGPLAPDGGLLPHPAAGRPYGGTPLQLRQAGQAGAPQAAPGAEVATPPAPAGPGGPTGAPPAVASTAPAPERDRAVTNSGCQLSLNGRQLGFSACTRLDGIGSDTTLMWALQPLGELAEDTARWGLSHTAHLDTSGPRACRLQCFARGGLGAGIHCSLLPLLISRLLHCRRQWQQRADPGSARRCGRLGGSGFSCQPRPHAGRHSHGPAHLPHLPLW